MLELEDGSSLQAHSQLLGIASTTFRDALHCASQASAAASQAELDSLPEPESPAQKCQKATLRLPLHGTSRTQALLLLHLLYAWSRQSFLDGLQPCELIELATCLDKFSCDACLLSLVDRRLVTAIYEQARAMPSYAIGYHAKRDDKAYLAASWLNVSNAPARHRLARKLQLTRLEDRVGGFLADHADEVDLKDVERSIAGVLRGACRIKKRLLLVQERERQGAEARRCARAAAAEEQESD